MGGRWRLWCEIIDATFGQVVSAITLSPALQAALPAASGSRSAGAAHTPRIPRYTLCFASSVPLSHQGRGSKIANSASSLPFHGKMAE